VGLETQLARRAVLQELQLPQLAWNRLLVAWTAFFLLLGSVNLVVAYRYSTETWVNFKTFGLLGLTFAYSISTGLTSPAT